ncbi:CC-NBS-LRR resistance protein [Tanacetum coccineum]|uniref:CC-NBS-LRR resistance protein n=1 Tax=Tanacetum coccineum TaxID=301880 RepID=A0ABQ5CBY8_9ASTR
MIYKSVTRKKCELPTMENLITMLGEVLGSKRYLLVLDDVWDEERAYWDDFRRCMVNVNSQNGNDIIVTTRKLEIGTIDMTKDSCTLQGLSDDEGWFMFKDRAKPLPDLEEIGRDVVRKCRGLSLLVKVLESMFCPRKAWFGAKKKNLSTSPYIDFSLTSPFGGGRVKRKNQQAAAKNVAGGDADEDERFYL